MRSPPFSLSLKFTSTTGCCPKYSDGNLNVSSTSCTGIVSLTSLIFLHIFSWSLSSSGLSLIYRGQYLHWITMCSFWSGAQSLLCLSVDLVLLPISFWEHRWQWNSECWSLLWLALFFLSSNWRVQPSYEQGYCCVFVDSIVCRLSSI